MSFVLTPSMHPITTGLQITSKNVPHKHSTVSKGTTLKTCYLA